MVSLSLTLVQAVQTVQVVQNVSERTEEVGLSGRFVAVYFDPFIPLRFRYSIRLLTMIDRRRKDLLASSQSLGATYD